MQRKKSETETHQGEILSTEGEILPTGRKAGERSFDPVTAKMVMKRVPTYLVEHILPTRWFERLEQDQKLRSCCRHPENHFIEGWKSGENEPFPDAYIFVCNCCGGEHHFFCTGETDVRPVWNNTIGDT